MSARAQTSAGASPSVLLVDDEPANLQLLYESLHGSGYRLLVARDGQQALDIAERMRPDVVLLDIMMPGMDGFEVCERIKAKQETSKIAVIFLSALVTPEDKAHGLRLGAVDYISKPFAPDELMARVETHCMMVRLGRELEQRNRELELSRDRVLRAMNEGVVGLDASGRVAYINPAAERILEAEAASMHGRDVGSLEPGRCARRWRPCSAVASRSRSPISTCRAATASRCPRNSVWYPSATPAAVTVLSSCCAT